ncbi:hypothetical protein EON64_16245, partial [archaeon]
MWWLAPAWIDQMTQGDGQVPSETYLLISQLPDSQFLVLLPLIDQEVSFSLEGSRRVDAEARDQVICVVGHRSPPQPARDCAALLVSIGPDLFALLAEAFALVRCRLRSEPFQSPASLRDPAWRFRGGRRGPGGGFADNLG